MIRSMTAFGRARADGADRDITVEIRSVNGRYFDCTVKTPREYAGTEERIRSYIRQNGIARGKIDVYVTVERHAAEDSLRLDEGAALAYVAALRRLRDLCGLTDDLSVMTVAQNRDLFSAVRSEEDADAEWQRLVPVLSEALRNYAAMRDAEGRRTEEDIAEKLSTVEEYAAQVARISRSDITGYRDRLAARIRQLLAENHIEPSDDRILAECAFYADKVAIDEELSRLASHFAAFRELVASPEPAGRRLDFLMQEMNRETNTIGSKANNAQIAHLVVAMKGELEKIREQIQNIE